MKNPYSKSKELGYSDEEIIQHLENHPKYSDKIKKSREAGYSDEDIGKFLATRESKKKPERSTLEKAGRTAQQFALGAAETALLPYEIGVAPLSIPGGQEALGDLFTRDILSDVYPAEEGDIPGPKERELAEPINIGIRGLVEKITGQDLHPEGVLEKAANWMGFLKDPKKIASLFKSGVTAKDVIKAVSPTGKDALRGAGAGLALQAAEDGEFGPIGTMASAVIGDLAGGAISSIGKAAVKSIVSPKKTVAEAISKITPTQKKELQKQVIKDLRESGIQADAGTIADSELIKMLQSRLAQSGLTGKAFEEFREGTTNQIKEEYKKLSEALGEAKFSTNHEAGQVALEGMKNVREADLSQVRKLYESSNTSLKEKAFVNSSKLAQAIEKIEKELTPGAIKSNEQKSVLNALDRLKQDLYDSSGRLMQAKVKDLMNNKIALNDIINYEVQGGAKQLLKGIVSELDRAIISHGRDNPTFVKNYVNANKRFSEHAKTFRNREVSKLLSLENPEQVLSRMNSIQGIRNVDKILSKSPEGKEISKNLKRLRLDQIVGDNMVDSTTKQIKLGTFSKLLEKGKNKELVKEILGSDAFKRLERLQKNAGKLADSANKFYNASKSGAVAVDAAIISKGITGLVSILSGNPWPLLNIGGGILGARKLSHLLTDPEFLKLLEEAILASEKGNEHQFFDKMINLKPYFLQYKLDES